jgi:mono/diheme cytochrome c family protein
LGGTLWAAEVPLKDQPHLRRPIAAAWLDENRILAVANQKSGSISIVDIEKRKVLGEFAVGERLADVASLPADGWLLAVDEKLHELIVLHWKAGKLAIAQRIPVISYPVSIAVAPSGTRCTVASLWTRTISTFEIFPGEAPAPPAIHKLSELSLDFAPGRQIFLPESEHVLVADAFTGQMALLDVAAESVVPIPAKDIFRIYAMTPSADPGGIYVAHQTLRPLPPPANGKAPKAADAIGTSDKAKMLTNFIGAYTIEGLLQGRLHHFAGSPEAPTKPGYMREDLRQMAELAPGPIAVTVDGRLQSLNPPPGKRQVTLRRFWDEIRVSHEGKPDKEFTIRLGPVGPLSAADRGEALFYDTRLSANGWVSCHTCHPDGHTTGQLVDTLGDGSKGTHKRALTLLGSGRTGKWAWNGEVQSLHEQVLQSVQKTMGKKTNPQTVSDIAAFVQTLPPPPPLMPASDDPADLAKIARSEALFGRLGCVECHKPAQSYTSDATYDVGLRDEKEMTKFNPPSLRGVSQGYSFFHDGRTETLEDVLITHRHPHGDELPEDQLADLVRFLKSL